MNIVYCGITATQNKPLPYGMYGFRLILEEYCRDNQLEFKTYSKSPDVLFLEIWTLGSFSIDRTAVSKVMQMLKVAKKVIIVINDAIAKAFWRDYKRCKERNVLPIGFANESLKYKKAFFEAFEKIYNGDYEVLINAYGENTDKYVPAKKIHHFDYSNLCKFVNMYDPLPREQRKILSYSFKKNKDGSDDLIKIIRGREQDCFKQLCEHRLCYMEAYKQSQCPIYWLRTRYAQCYYANALMIGLTESYFGKDMCISIDDYKKMSEEEFEEAVKKQKQAHEKLTKTKEQALTHMKELLTIGSFE